MATIKDIAKAAGVSRGTVSNVLNKRGCVSHEKILLVEKAATRMGYVIDKNAGSLRKGVTDTLALILPSISDTRYSDLYLGIRSRAQEQGFSLRLYLTDDLPFKERDAIREAMTERIRAILTVSCLTHHKDEYKAALTASLPVLFLERPAGKDLCSYSFDMKAVARIIAAYIPRGKTIRVLTDNASFSDQKTLRNALLKQAGITKEDLFENVRGEQSLSAYDLLAKDAQPDCIFTANETLAGHIRRVYAAGNGSVPRVISLVSLKPSQDAYVTGIRLNYRRMGSDAACAMMAHLQKGDSLTSKVYDVSGYDDVSSAQIPRRKKKTTLRIIMHDTPAVRALKRLVPEFTYQTGIDAEITSLPLQQVFEQVLSGRGRWDVIRIDPSSLSYLAPRIFLPLHELDAEIDCRFRQFLPSLARDFSVSGAYCYALPFDVSVQMLFYRKTLFEHIAERRAYYEETSKELSVPATYEDLESVSRFFTRAYRKDSPTVYGASVAMHHPTSASSEFLPRLLYENGLIYTPEGRLNLMTDAAMKALTQYLSFAACAHVPTDEGWSNIAEDLVRGAHALSVLYVNHASHVVRAQLAASGSEIGFAPMPGGHFLLAGGTLGVSAHSHAPEEAYSFIRWATGEEIAPRLVMMGATSACRVVYEHEEILDTYPWMRELPRLMEKGVRRPTLAFGDASLNQRDFEYRLGENIIRAYHREITPEEALSDTQLYLDTVRS